MIDRSGGDGDGRQPLVLGRLRQQVLHLDGGQQADERGVSDLVPDCLATAQSSPASFAACSTHWSQPGTLRVLSLLRLTPRFFRMELRWSRAESSTASLIKEATAR